MKTLNLVMAIIYTIVYVGLILSGIVDNDAEVVIGSVFLSGPLVVNWITYFSLKK